MTLDEAVGKKSSTIGRWLANIVALIPIIFRTIWPKSVLDIFSFLGLPDTIRSTGAELTWSVSHLDLWSPIVLGIILICAANWKLVRASWPRKRAYPWAFVLVVLAVSYFIPTGNAFDDHSAERTAAASVVGAKEPRLPPSTPTATPSPCLTGNSISGITVDSRNSLAGSAISADHVCGFTASNITVLHPPPQNKIIEIEGVVRDFKLFEKVFAMENSKTQK